MRRFSVLICLLFFTFVFSVLSCVSNAASAEEYFSIGMAYYDLGKFSDAEKWLLRAASADKTKTASEYNLGRIAFETGRFAEAAGHFENVLKRDPENVMALKAAAYTYIKTNNIKEAETLYDRVLKLAPESSDDGYNYALVLFALGKYDECRITLLNYPFALDEKPDSLLLLARAQAASERVEAADSYAKWLAGNSAANPKVLHEYAQVLEKAELYALALEQYREGLAAMRDDLPNLRKNQIRFDAARVLLIADPANAEAISELQTAIDEGFDDINALEALLYDSRIDDEQKTEIAGLLENLLNSENS